MEILSFLLFVIIILILSALVSGSEAALLSINYAKIKDLQASAKSKARKKKVERLLEIKENLQFHITTIVILNNIINIIGSIYVGVLATRLFGEFYLGFISAVLTFLIIIFSEIIPKMYGEQHSRSISLKVATPLYFITKILKPLVYIFNFLSKVFVKQNNEKTVSDGEIKELAGLGVQEGSINAYERDVIENILEMENIDVYEIMVPKSKAVLIEKSTSFEEIVETIEKTGHTRFPISKGGEIIGLINVKDLFKYHGREERFSISKIIRPIIIAPEAMKISTLEKKLKKQRTHMAAIVNEHGDFTGIITLEDIIEEILGDIEDEHDKKPEESIIKLSDKKYYILGSSNLEEINTYFKDNILPVSDDHNTLNGFLISRLDKIPRVNNKLDLDKVSLRVINATKKKVLKVELILKED